MQGVLAFLIYPYLSAYLGNEHFGFFMLGISFTNFVIPVFVGAMSNSLMRQQRDVPETQAGGFWMTGALTILALGVALGGLLILFAGPLALRWNIPQLALWLPALVPSMIGTMLYYNLRLQLIARAKFARMVLCDVFYGIGLLAVPAGCAMGLLENLWPLLFVLAPAAGISALLVNLVQLGGLSFSGVNFKSLRLIVAPMSIYLFGLASGWLLRMSDRWILGETGLPGEQIAYYSVAIQASFLVLFPLEHISVVLMSMFSNVKDLDHISRKQIRRYFAVLGISIAGLAVFAPLLGYGYIRLLFGTEYLRIGMPVFLIALAGMMIYLFQMFGRGIVVRFRHPVTDPIISTFFFVISFGLIWFLVPRFGVLGAAVGRSIGFAGVGAAFFAICQWELIGRMARKKDSQNAISSMSAERPVLD